MLGKAGKAEDDGKEAQVKGIAGAEEVADGAFEFVDVVVHGDFLCNGEDGLFYSNPPKASYGVALPRRTKTYCLRQRALSETFGVSLYIRGSGDRVYQ